MCISHLLQASSVSTMLEGSLDSVHSSKPQTTGLYIGCNGKTNPLDGCGFTDPEPSALAGRPHCCLPDAKGGCVPLHTDSPASLYAVGTLSKTALWAAMAMLSEVVG